MIRDRQVLVRLSSDEHARLSACAEAQGMTLATFARSRMLEAARQFAPSVKPGKIDTVDALDPWTITGIHQLCYYIRSGESVASLKASNWSAEEIAAARTIANSPRMLDELRAKGAAI